MKLILVRHGETNHNAEHRLTGQSDPPLNEQGNRQADAVAQRLANLPIDRFFSSTLTRARKTADIIALHHNSKVTELTWLQERHGGVLQGLNKTELKSHYREDHRAYKSTELDQVIAGGGESRRTFHGRITAGLTELAVIHHTRTVLVVTHTGVLREVFNHVFHTAQNGNHLRSANGSICTFIHEKGLWSLETWGDVAHLASVGTSIEAF